MTEETALRIAAALEAWLDQDRDFIAHAKRRDAADLRRTNMFMRKLDWTSRQQFEHDMLLSQYEAAVQEYQNALRWDKPNATELKETAFALFVKLQEAEQ